jgi:hypothetical protein
MDKSITEYLKKLEPEQKKIVNQLRSIILRTLPHLKEEYKWRVPFYHPVAYINAVKDHVNLGFLYGAILTDPNELLSGTGKNLRHYKIKEVKDLKKRQIAAWLHESWELHEQISQEKRRRKK